MSDTALAIRAPRTVEPGDTNFDGYACAAPGRYVSISAIGVDVWLSFLAADGDAKATAAEFAIPSGTTKRVALGAGRNRNGAETRFAVCVDSSGSGKQYSLILEEA